MKARKFESTLGGWQMPAEKIDDLDQFIYCVESIGRAANIVKDDGSVDVRGTYYALEKGYIDADKFGRKWRTTPRRVRSTPRLGEV
jgi:hypothetical protein